MNMSQPLDRYRVFRQVALAGSFSQAAEDLFLSQPAISHAVKKLEQEMGSRLFVRTARGTALTVEGEVLLSYVDQAIRLIEAGERHVVDLQHLDRGNVRIGAGDTLCRHYLLPVLDEFHRDHPHVQLDVTNRTTRETVELLLAGKIDFGLVNLPIWHDQIVVIEGPTIQDCFVVGERYKALADCRHTPPDIAKERLVVLETGSVTRDHLDAFFRSYGITVKPEIELGSIDLIVDFARMGLGVSAVIRNFVQDELSRGVLYEVPITPMIPHRAIGLVVPKLVPLSVAAQSLTEYLRAHWHET